jgi:hypothetical protein
MLGEARGNGMNSHIRVALWWVASAGIWLVAALLIQGCATEVKRTPIAFTSLPSTDSAAIVTVLKDVEVVPATGYPRTIRGGSQWRLVGGTPRGDVYRPVSGVLTVESAQVHEAGLVISGGKLVGFYMLVEKAFVPLDPPADLQLSQGAR